MTDLVILLKEMESFTLVLSLIQSFSTLKSSSVKYKQEFRQITEIQY